MKNNTSNAVQVNNEPAIGFIPCYRLPFLYLFHADCMEIMKQYPDKYFDLAIVDPPYGINWHTSGGNKRLWNSRNGKKTKKWDIRPNSNYFIELKRITKSQIIFGGNYFISDLEDSNTVLIWDKKNRGSMFADAEIALCYIEDFTKLKQMKGNRIIELKSNVIDNKIHATQKPVDLYDWILTKYANENFKILDTYFGSGSIALAVDKANRLDKKNLHLTACETDKEYIDKAIKRISESIKQGTLSF
ncbi:MAG: DNA methyltransferase [Candidatus Paceibacterota bacterium]